MASVKSKLGEASEMGMEERLARLEERLTEKDEALREEHAEHERKLEELIAQQARERSESESRHRQEMRALAEANSTEKGVPNLVVRPRETVQKFLESRLPDSMFFCPANPFYKAALIADKRASVDPLERGGQRTQPVVMEMKLWGGPGSELQGKGSEFVKRPINTREIGFCLLHRDSKGLVRVTREDVRKFHLVPEDASPKDIEDCLNPEGHYPLEELIEKVRHMRDFEEGRVIDGRTFQLLLEADYKVIWAQQEIFAERDRKGEQLRQGAHKTGLPLVGVS
jgi:hypothetical protein